MLGEIFLRCSARVSAAMRASDALVMSVPPAHSRRRPAARPSGPSTGPTRASEFVSQRDRYRAATITTTASTMMPMVSTVLMRMDPLSFSM